MGDMKGQVGNANGTKVKYMGVNGKEITNDNVARFTHVYVSNDLIIITTRYSETH